MRTENDLGKDELSKLVLRIAIPSMLAQFVSVLYSIVDRMYIGNITQVGEIALAGVGICGPIVTMVGSFAGLVAMGGAPLMSIKMGEGKHEEAQRILANSLQMLIFLSVILVAVLMTFRQPILMFFGASELLYPYAEVYFRTYLWGTLFALLATGLNQFIICQGFAKIAMKSVLLGAITNIVLDPIFIFTFGLGCEGAAIATVLSQLASCIYVCLFLWGEVPPIRLTYEKMSGKVIGQIIRLGFTPFAIIAIDNVMIIAMNMILQRYGGTQGDFLITCVTIAQSFMLLVTMPLSGISGGTQSILSYNFGARNQERVLKAQKLIFAYCAGYTTLMFILARFAGPLFIRLFTQDAAVIEQTRQIINVLTLAIIPLGIQYEIVDGFTAMGQVQLSLPLSFFRKSVYFSALILLPMVYGVQSVFYAEALSDILGPLCSIFIYLFSAKKIVAKGPQF